MPLNARPILSALGRNRTGALLVALEIAIAIAVMVNAVWIVAQRVHDIDRPTGIDQRNIFELAVSGVTTPFDYGSTEREDLAYLRSIPGVIAATASSAIPFTDFGQGNALRLHPTPLSHQFWVRSLEIDTQGLATLGVRILAGRNFNPTEIVPYSRNYSPPASEVLVTQAFAHKLFPHGNAVGQTVYGSNDEPMTIIGVTSNFIGSVIDTPSYDGLIYPQEPGGYGMYICLVRTAPGKAAALMQIAEQHLAADNQSRVIFDAHVLDYYKQQLDQQNRNMALFLSTVTVLILAVTCLGIFGLTAFNVSTRTKQIGTMRAVGARKADVVAYFLTENAIILAAGILVGSGLALAVGAWLSSAYALPRLDLTYLAVGVVALAAIGQLAAWHPARRAAAVPPSVATQTI
jgi:putative ABC transport system permease protein